MNYSHIGIAATCCLLFACSTVDQSIKPEPLPQTQRNHQLQQWQVSGRIGLKHAKELSSGSFIWQQCDQQFSLTITGPMGLGGVKINGDRQAFTLRQGGNTYAYLANEKTRLTQQLGFNLPLQQLPYWLRGMAFPESINQLYDNGFSQAGWLLEYSRWQMVDDYFLPGKLRSTAANNLTRVTLLLTQWHLTTDCPLNE